MTGFNNLPTPEAKERRCKKLPTTASKYERELTHEIKMKRKAARKLSTGFTPVPPTGWRAVEAAKRAAREEQLKELAEGVVQEAKENA